MKTAHHINGWQKMCWLYKYIIQASAITFDSEWDCDWTKIYIGKSNRWIGLLINSVGIIGCMCFDFSYGDYTFLFGRYFLIFIFMFSGKDATN